MLYQRQRCDAVELPMRRYIERKLCFDEMQVRLGRNGLAQWIDAHTKRNMLAQLQQHFALMAANIEQPATCRYVLYSFANALLL